MALTLTEIKARREQDATPQRVVFKVAGLYGLNRVGVRLPVSETETIDSGPICNTVDPEADPSGNVGECHRFPGVA